MKITQEMYDDWCSLEGYSDFRGGGVYKTYDAGDGLIVYERSDDGYIRVIADTAKDGWRGHTKTCPDWHRHTDTDLTRYNLLCIAVSPGIIEPEFSLDEIAIAENIIQRD